MGEAQRLHAQDGSIAVFPVRRSPDSHADTERLRARIFSRAVFDRGTGRETGGVSSAGAWGDGPRDLRSAVRFRGSSVDRGGPIGFRLAEDL